MQEYKPEPGEVGARVDVFVAAKYPAFTRSALVALFTQKLVSLNGKPTKAAQRIKPGDKLVVDEQLLNLEPPAIELPVIYEDEDVIVIDKPAGVLSHSKGALNLEATVASFIKPKLNGELLQGNRAGIVHRLDRGTSGVMIAAKNAAAAKYLQKQFASRKTKKAYLAVVEGVPEPSEGIIDVPLARNPRNPKTFTASAAGKPAQTAYKVAKNMEKNGRSYALLELKPITGRTHQLRVHLAYIKHPVAGDFLYGHESSAPRLMLHASQLELTLPSGQHKVFTAPTPKDFQINEN